MRASQGLSCLGSGHLNLKTGNTLRLYNPWLWEVDLYLTGCWAASTAFTTGCQEHPSPLPITRDSQKHQHTTKVLAGEIAPC